MYKIKNAIHLGKRWLAFRIYFMCLERMSKDSVILLLVAIAFVGWCGAIGFHNSTNMLERRIGLMYEQVKELRHIDKQKCIDLFMQ